MKRTDTTAWIVDDDHTFIYILQKQLKMIDHFTTVKAFTNGLEALKYLNGGLVDSVDLPDVIFLDLNMRLLDGWQFLDEFVQLSLPKEITIYIVSSSIDPQDHRKAKEYKEVKHFFVKPVTKDDLVHVVRNITYRNQ